MEANKERHEPVLSRRGSHREAELPSQADVEEPERAEGKDDEHETVKQKHTAFDLPAPEVKILQRTEEDIDRLELARDGVGAAVVELLRLGLGNEVADFLVVVKRIGGDRGCAACSTHRDRAVCRRGCGPRGRGACRCHRDPRPPGRRAWPARPSNPRASRIARRSWG